MIVSLLLVISSSLRFRTFSDYHCDQVIVIFKRNFKIGPSLLIYNNEIGCF